MANRTIELTLKAEVGRFVAGLKTARDSVNATSRDVADFVRNNEQDMRTVGTGLATIGTALTAMTVGATKAAIDWESSWADVQKVNDGTHDQMVRLEEDLREMARTIPATHEEIAAVAEAAGRLGVEVDSVAEFSRVMIDLGNTTTLNADEAATAIARFSNIMGTSWDDTERLGSTIVDLGNNFATTETEIMHLAQRLAPFSATMNMAESDTLAMAAAMSSVGIRAEAGGSAMGRVMQKIDADVRAGGEALQGWAETSGVTAEEFASAWQDRPAEAIHMLTEGLASTAASGGDVSAMLGELGISGQQEISTMLSLANASEELGSALETGASAWAENTALSDEAAIRYETAAMKIKTAWASVYDALITAGAAIAPMVGDVAESVGAAADAFGSLPDPVLQGVTALSGVVGVTALAGAGLLLLAPRAVETYRAFRSLQAASKNLPSSLRNVARYAGVAAVAFAGFTIMREVANSLQPATASVEDMTAALIRLDTEGDPDALSDVFDSSDFAGFSTEVDTLAGSLDSLDPSNPIQHLASFGSTVLGLRNSAGRAAEGIETLDTALAGMDAETAANHMSNLRDEAEAAGRQDFSSWESLKELLPEYAASIQEAANATGEHYSEAELLEAAMGNLPPAMQAAKDAADDAARQDELVGALEEVGVAADGTVESLSEYLDMLFQTGLAEQSAMQAQASYQESLDGVTAAVEQIKSEHGGLSGVLNDSKDGFDVTTEAGRIAQAAFLDVASSGQDMASAMAEAGESQEDIQESLEGTYDDLIATAGEFGITGSAAEDLARKVLGVPDGVDIETWMDETAQEKANELGASLDEIPPGLDIITSMDDSARAKAFETGEAVDAITGYKKVDVAISEDGTAGQVQSKVDSITGKTEYVFVTDDGTTTTVQQQIVNIDGVNRTVYVDDAGTVYATQSEINGITDGSSFISVTDNASDADGRINNAARDRTATITVTQRIHQLKVPQRAHPNIMAPNIATGGRAPRAGLPQKSGGGRLPYTGLGTDEILGVNALGNPVAWVDDLEWIVNRRSSDKYDSVLDRINRDHPSVQHLAHLRDGGRAGQLASSAMAMSPSVSVSAPPVDTAAIGAAVGAAIRSYQPVVQIGGRQFAGVMQEVQQQYVARR